MQPHVHGAYTWLQFPLTSQVRSPHPPALRGEGAPPLGVTLRSPLGVTLRSPNPAGRPRSGLSLGLLPRATCWRVEVCRLQGGV